MNYNKMVYKNILNDKYAKERFKIFKSLLNPFIKKDVKVLDIGCYMGDTIKIFGHKNIKYYGVDFDKKALKIAKKRGAFKVFKVNLENEKIKLNEKFDIIILAEILEHLKDPEKLILQTKKLLNKKGVVLISLPNESTIYHRIKMVFGNSVDATGFAADYHLHFPTIKQDNEFIEKHFKIISRRYWIHLGVSDKIEKGLSLIPKRVWDELTYSMPSLFSRGIIFLCKLKTNKDN